MKLNNNISTIINGETGVGKTCLVRYLSQMIDGTVFTLNVHAGRSQKSIIDWIRRIIKLTKNEKFKTFEWKRIQDELKDKDKEQTDSTIELIDRIDDLIKAYDRACLKQLSSILFAYIKDNVNHLKQ